MGKIADRYFQVHPWEIRETGYNPDYAQVSESIFSLGNEYMGVRGYFEEGGARLLGSYVSGVYERRGLEKSGYRGMLTHMEFMVNTVDWLYTRISCNGVALAMDGAGIAEFVRVLDLRTGVLTRSFTWQVDATTRLAVRFERFLSMCEEELGAQRVTVAVLAGNAALTLNAGLDFSPLHATDQKNFWACTNHRAGEFCHITGTTIHTQQTLHASARFLGLGAPDRVQTGEQTVCATWSRLLCKGQEATLQRIACLEKGAAFDAAATQARLDACKYDALKQESAAWWASQWALSDICIEGDEENQQGIRYSIFQLHQTLHTARHGAVIGAKGLTGEAYNGNTFWDSEVYCLPFYLFNNPEAAKSILQFRYETLPQARERARALDCKGAFYPVATISGTECCNLWQHASLQLQPSTSVAYGFWCYEQLTGDTPFVYAYGAEILVEICRMLATRGDWDPVSGEYGFYGVMGPDEFQMMVHHNAYTNFMAKKTFAYTQNVLARMEQEEPGRYAALVAALAITQEELALFARMEANMRIPYDASRKLFEQHDGFFRLPRVNVNDIPVEDFPLYHHWSYERIYRNDMIKQPDVLMFMLLYNSDFTQEQVCANYEYYEPRCIHESSLSPSVHSILAAQLHKHAQAYELFRFAARLDLDNYNRNTNEGLHTTSIAGSWMNIVYGFGGLRSDAKTLSLAPCIPANWDAYAFSLLHAGKTLYVRVTGSGVSLRVNTGKLDLVVYGKRTIVGEEGILLPIPGKWSNQDELVDHKAGLLA